MKHESENFRPTEIHTPMKTLVLATLLSMSCNCLSFELRGASIRNLELTACFPTESEVPQLKVSCRFGKVLVNDDFAKKQGLTSILAYTGPGMYGMIKRMSIVMGDQEIKFPEKSLACILNPHVNDICIEVLKNRNIVITVSCSESDALYFAKIYVDIKLGAVTRSEGYINWDFKPDLRPKGYRPGDKSTLWDIHFDAASKARTK